MNVVCPSCNSDHVKRSRSRSIVERIMKRFNRKAYRCLDCGWRGIVAVSKVDGPFVETLKRNGRTPRKMPWLVIVIVSLLLALSLIFFMTREPESSLTTGRNFPPATSPVFPA
jgi:predicted RNA-binding Zn-ribbon protein involved in translation (DUF1610 family)